MIEQRLLKEGLTFGSIYQHRAITTELKYYKRKIFTMLGEVGMANELTKTTQTSVWMAQCNEQNKVT